MFPLMADLLEDRWYHTRYELREEGRGCRRLVALRHPMRSRARKGQRRLRIAAVVRVEMPRHCHARKKCFQRHPYANVAVHSRNKELKTDLGWRAAKTRSSALEGRKSGLSVICPACCPPPPTAWTAKCGEPLQPTRLFGHCPKSSFTFTRATLWSKLEYYSFTANRTLWKSLRRGNSPVANHDHVMVSMRMVLGINSLPPSQPIPSLTIHLRSMICAYSTLSH